MRMGRRTRSGGRGRCGLRSWLVMREPLKPKVLPKVRANRGKLRVGFLSGSFYNHPVSQFVGPLLSALPHEGMEVYCYASVANPDGVTNWLQTLAVKWRDVSRMSDEA